MTVPFYDFGGNGPLVHFAHANGFPPATYRPFIATLTDRCHVIGLPARPLWPGSRPEEISDWHPMAEDLIRALDEAGLRGIVGIGHSMGGVVTLWVATERPDLFRAVVLIDPVILPPHFLLVARTMRRLGLVYRYPLVRQTLRRRRTWPDRETCFRYLREKPFFARWPDESLWAYVEAGTRERPGGEVELVYSPEWEARIFALVPADVWRAVPRLQAPALIIRGEHSGTFLPQAMEHMRRLLPGARYHVVPDAGHMVPLERPVETGAVVRAFLEG
ncbi:MAG: alpha/beta hydrolase [Thermoflexia bacterium]|nr:MAG: alpha/beta hydrolase [Thermoflexia bacterium]